MYSNLAFLPVVAGLHPSHGRVAQSSIDANHHIIPMLSTSGGKATHGIVNERKPIPNN